MRATPPPPTTSARACFLTRNSDRKRGVKQVAAYICGSWVFAY